MDPAGDVAGPWALDRRGTRAVVIAPPQPAASLRRGIVLLELPSGKELFSLPWPKDPDRGLVVSPWDMQIAVHGDRLAAAKLDEECDWLVLWDLARPGEPVRTFRFPHEPARPRPRSQPVQISPDGRHAAVGLFDRRVAVVRTDGSGEPTLAAPPNPERVELRAWLPERPWWLLVDRPADGPAIPLVWDYAAGGEVYRLPPCEPDALVAVADATRVAVGTPAGSVRLYDAATGRALGETPALHSRPLTRFHPLPDGRLSTAADDGTLRLWSPITWPAGLRVLPVAPGTEQVAFCPDRELMVAARPTTPPTEQSSFSRRTAFAVHDARTGRELRSWEEDVGPYHPVPLPGGRLVTLGDASPFAVDKSTGKPRGQAIKVRDLATGELASERHGGELGVLVLLNIDGLRERDGRLLYAGHYPDTINPKGVAVWDLLAVKEVARLTGPDLASRRGRSA